MLEAAAQPSRPETVADAAVPLATLVERTASDPLQSAPRAELVTAAVLSVEADGASLLGAGLGRARRAASCLIEPAADDLVLAACVAGAEPIVIAVLTRVAAVATLSVPEASGMILSAPMLGLQTPALEVEAETARLTVTETHLAGRAARVVLDTAETVYSTLQQYAQKLVVKAGHALRIVDEVDSSVASTVLVQAKQTYSVQATQIVTSATEDVRLDGERISMG